jgi:hypothetical protein
MKCTCEFGKMQICRNCFLTVIEHPRRVGYRQDALHYASSNRNMRVVYHGEHYAKPMPIFEYLYQIMHESEAV